MTSAIRSKLLIGKVMHHRMQPAQHRFIYPIFLLRLDLDELEAEHSPLSSGLFSVNRWRPLSIQTSDYGPRDGSSLKQWAIKTLNDAGIPSPSRIELQTFPRIFSYAFNPISIWYCYDPNHHLMALIAEVNNTFGDHHFYVLRNEKNTEINGKKLLSKKAMHVSPFCEVKGHYEFQFKEKCTQTIVRIDYFEDQTVTLKTAISAKQHILNTRNLGLAFARQPLLTFGVFWRIHWQAFLLWLKAVPFFRLPVSSSNRITLGSPVREEQ